MNDVEYADELCPKCGHEMVWEDCPELGCDDGFIHMHEYDDPLWYDDGDFEACEECRGIGHITWCQNCGYCVNDGQDLPAGFHVDLPGE